MKNRRILFQGDSPNVSRDYLELMQAMFEIELIIPSQLRIANATAKLPRLNMRNATADEP